ncbi:MAG: hypothetical protein RLZZ227_1592 [Pseudomonadota bacterium]
MSFSGQNKAIVLLINDSGMQLFAWEKGKLAWKQTFSSTPEELEKFGAALASFPGFPAIILTDLIEESFRHDSVVHVTGGDRAAVLKRKLDFVFRNTNYRVARVTERETTGRRDDRILLSAITKPDLIEVWVRALLEHHVAIQSVTSVAHLLHDFIAIAKLDQDEFLLVINVEPGGNLRQTFIRKGMVLFSRLTPMQARENILLGSDVLQETLQLRQYFERIQFVPYEAVLRVHVYSAFDDRFLQLEARSSESNRFEVIDVGPLIAALQVSLDGQEPCPVHYFVAKVLAGKKLENVYAPPAATKYQDLRSFAHAIWGTTAAMTLLGLGVCIPPALSVWNQWEQRDAFIAQARPLKAEYARLSEGFPETPIPSSEMQLVVETHDIIQRQIHSPLDALNMISRALASSTGLHLTSITWELVEKPSETDVANDADGNGATALSSNATPVAQGITALVLAERTAIKVLIEGEAFSPDSFREAQEQVNSLVDALSQNPAVSIFASKMPIEVRTDVSVSTTVDDSEVRAPFALELTLLMGEPQQLASDEVTQ